jgi:uncharacterized protein DUF1707
MAGSAGDAEDDMATGPDLRIGDADRETVATRLREHYVQGRLTLEEFNERLDAVFAATMQSQLSTLTRDLPPVASPSAPLPVATSASRDRAGWERAGRGGRSGSRARLGLIPAIIAAVAAWLLIADLQLRMFPWPGKLAIFLLIFGVVRGVMRRIWRVGRGGYMGRGRYPGGR